MYAIGTKVRFIPEQADFEVYDKSAKAYADVIDQVGTVVEVNCDELCPYPYRVDFNGNKLLFREVELELVEPSMMELVNA